MRPWAKNPPSAWNACGRRLASSRKRQMLRVQHSATGLDFSPVPQRRRLSMFLFEYGKPSKGGQKSHDRLVPPCDARRVLFQCRAQSRVEPGNAAVRFLPRLEPRLEPPRGRSAVLSERDADSLLPPPRTSQLCPNVTTETIYAFVVSLLSSLSLPSPDRLLLLSMTSPCLSQVMAVFSKREAELGCRFSRLLSPAFPVQNFPLSSSSSLGVLALFVKLNSPDLVHSLHIRVLSLFPFLFLMPVVNQKAGATTMGVMHPSAIGPLLEKSAM